MIAMVRGERVFHLKSSRTELVYVTHALISEQAYYFHCCIPSLLLAEGNPQQQESTPRIIIVVVRVCVYLFVRLIVVFCYVCMRYDDALTLSLSRFFCCLFFRRRRRFRGREGIFISNCKSFPYICRPGVLVSRQSVCCMLHGKTVELLKLRWFQLGRVRSSQVNSVL